MTVETLFLGLLNMSLSASLVAVAVLGLRLVLQKLPKAFHCLLWGMVGLRLLIPVFPESKISMLPSARVIPETALEKPLVQTGITAVNNAVNPVLTQVNTDRVSLVLTVLIWVWVAGCLALLGYGIFTYFRVRRQVRVSLKRDGVYLCDDIDVPFVLGLFRPRIYAPSYLSGERLAHVKAHENAHLRRHDHWWKPLGFLLLCLHWFNPVLWAAYILLCRDIEKACDQAVIRKMDPSTMRSYSETLLACSLRDRMILACPLAFGEVAVKNRIRSILHYKKPTFWAVLFMIVVSFVCTGCFLTNPMPCLHNYAAVCTVAPTCTQEGVMTHTCEKCWDSYTTAAAVAEHTYGEGFISKEATCGEAGQTSATCTACQYTCVTGTLPKTDDHTMVHSVLQQATCTQQGQTQAVCSVCGAAETAAIPMTEHTYVEGMLMAATCSREGSRQMVCTGCGKEQWYSIPTNGEHAYMDSINGTQQCMYCGASRKKTGAWVYDNGLGDVTSVIGSRPGTAPQLPTIQWAP